MDGYACSVLVNSTTKCNTIDDRQQQPSLTASCGHLPANPRLPTATTDAAAAAAAVNASISPHFVLFCSTHVYVTGRHRRQRQQCTKARLPTNPLARLPYMYPFCPLCGACSPSARLQKRSHRLDCEGAKVVEAGLETLECDHWGCHLYNVTTLTLHTRFNA